MQTLSRSIGLVGAVGFGLGAMVGTGVFVMTGVAAGMAGPAMLVSLALAGLAAACNGLALAQLAMKYPEAGATYVYAGKLLSPTAGFLAGWTFIAAKATSAAATAIAFGGYVGNVTGVPPLVVTLALVAAVTALNLRRLTEAGAVNIVLIAVSIGSLLVFIAAGVGRFDAGRLTPFAPEGLTGILAAAGILFVAYAGYGRIATLGEEVHEPRRTIPIALLSALAAAAVLYAAVSLVAIGMVGAPAFGVAAEGKAPLRDIAPTPFAAKAVAMGAAAALGSVFLNLMLGLSRMTFAMARGRDLPPVLARVNDASSPWTAVLALGVVVGALSCARSIVILLSLSAFSVLVYYTLANLSALRLKREERLVWPAVQVCGVAMCVLLAVFVKPREIATGAAVLAAGLVARLAIRRTT